MLRNKALPVETREFPPYTYREFPKMLGNVGSKEEPNWIVADNAQHEQALRDKYPDLPPWVAPAASFSQADIRTIQEELVKLRRENALLKAGGAVVPDDIKVETELPRAPRPSVPRTGDGGDVNSDALREAELAKLAANEHPDGDPWAAQPENANPAENAKPPSIKDRGRAPPPNKLGR